MKTIHYFFLICCFMFSVSCNQNKGTQEQEYSEEYILWDGNRPNDTYEYPVREDLGSIMPGQKRFEVCQIPKTIVEKMSTQGIIQSLLEYPMLYETIYCEHHQLYFELAFCEGNNGFLELVNRKYAGRAIFERLEQADPIADYYTETEPLKLYLRVHTAAIEMFIAQYTFLNQLNDDEKREVVEIALRNDNLRQKEFADYLFYRTSLFLLGWALFAADYFPFVEAVNRNDDLKYFLDGYYPKRDGGSNLKWWCVYGMIEKNPAYSYSNPYWGETLQQVLFYANKYLTEK